MRTLFAKYGYLLIWIGAILLIGVVFWLIIQANAHLTPLPPAPPPPAAREGPPPPPPPPSVTLTVQKSSKGNTLRVQWANLPANTTSLDIFRSPKNKNQWSLWKQITIAPGELASGSVSINIGSSLYSNYSFYVAAGGGAGGGDGSGSAGSIQILWTSSSTTATVVTSTSGLPPAGAAATAPAPQAPSPASSTSSSTSSPNASPSAAPSSTSGGSTPTGTPYYTPQLQISNYGSSPSGTFWVQHVDQKIQIGWQNLPANTTSISVLRSSDQNGPWTTVLTQANPGVNGYSIQVVDNTVGQPYYYEMQAFAGSSVIATYGPVYLPPVGQ